MTPLLPEPTPILLELPNGLRVVHQPVASTRLVLVAIIVNCGSRDELPHQQGSAHFIEHMVFKGTQRRKAFHILNRIDAVGGDLNAYTDKEKTVYHATVAAEYFERALDLLADIVFRPTFAPAEVGKEKQVIAEEIDMYADNPEESIVEDLEQLLFAQHPLGHPILGTKETIGSFTPESLRAFASAAYQPGRVVVSVVGNLDERTLKRVCTKVLADIEAPAPTAPVAARTKPEALGAAQHLQLEKPHQQAHWIAGTLAYPLRHDLLPAFLVLNNYLGGNAMNTVLNLRIREKYGLAYSLYSYGNHYTDTGTWMLHAAAEPNALQRIQTLCEREVKALCQTQLSPAREAQVRQQFLGAMKISAESLFQQLIAQGKDLQDFQDLQPLTEALQKIEEVTAAEMLQVANEVFHPSLWHTVTYLPRNTDED